MCAKGGAAFTCEGKNERVRECKQVSANVSHSTYESISVPSMWVVYRKQRPLGCDPTVSMYAPFIEGSRQERVAVSPSDWEQL